MRARQTALILASDRFKGASLGRGQKLPDSEREEDS